MSFTSYGFSLLREQSFFCYTYFFFSNHRYWTHKSLIFISTQNFYKIFSQVLVNLYALNLSKQCLYMLIELRMVFFIIIIISLPPISFLAAARRVMGLKQRRYDLDLQSRVFLQQVECSLVKIVHCMTNSIIDNYGGKTELKSEQLCNHNV